MKSPKTRFLENKEDAQFHYELVVNDRFLRALDAAMLQMIHGQPGDGNEFNASSRYNMLAGASEFVRIFLHLSEAPPKPNPTPKQNLNHLA